MRIVIFFSISFTMLLGCSYTSSNAEIISAIDNALNVKSPKEFDLVSVSSSSSVSGYISGFEVSYSKENMEMLIKQVDLSTWVQGRRWMQYSVDNGDNTGVIITISGNNLRYQFGEQ